MNSVQIHDQQIELVFQTGDTVHVDVWAIKELNFYTNGAIWTFDPGRKEMLTAVKITSLKLAIDVEDPKMFWTTNRNRDTDSVKQDGENCIVQLNTRRDLSFLTINGVNYLVPLREHTELSRVLKLPYKVNELQKNHIEKNNKTGHRIITIQVERNDGN